MPKPKLSVVTELELDAFRKQHLTPISVLRAIERHVQLLLRLPVGVGKTHAAVALLLWPLLYKRFDLVFYATPSWNILNEVIARIDEAKLRGWRVLYPRPAEMCADLDQEWREYEASSCSTLAKRKLCKSRCPHGSDCSWPNQLSHVKGTKLFLLTEQRIGLVRAIIPLLKARSGGRRVLVILDEARILDTDFEITLSREEIELFGTTLVKTRCHDGGWEQARTAWLRDIDSLLRCQSDRGMRTAQIQFTSDLHRSAYHIQRCGWAKCRPDFKYSGYDLSLLAESRKHERWVDGDEFRFIGRPLLKCHLLLLSAHVTADYAGHRLGEGPIRSPFEDVRFLHSGSRIVNLRNSVGAARHFDRNHHQILDTFAVLIARNIHEGRTTLLVSRKKFKERCAAYLRNRLTGWGLDVCFECEKYDQLPATPDPRVIPIIHYGILGVNDFTSYQSAYCLNSYYVNGRKLNEAVQEFEARHFRIQLEIVRGPDRMRRVRITDPEIPDEDRTLLAEIYLRKLEVDPVIQAAGRVRFLTEAREVVFFQMNDLEREIGRIEEVRSLVALRKAFGIPSAREIDDALEGRRARNLMGEGMSAEQVAERLGISRATVFRRLKAFESLSFPLIDSLRKSETPPGPTGPREGVA